MENNCILNALKSLRENVDKVDNKVLKDNEKNVVAGMIDKLTIYYVNTYNNLVAHARGRDLFDVTVHLSCKMTDLIVKINDVIRGKADVYGVVNDIYKEINYDASKEQFKRKRLI